MEEKTMKTCTEEKNVNAPALCFQRYPKQKVGVHLFFIMNSSSGMNVSFLIPFCLILLCPKALMKKPFFVTGDTHPHYDQ